MKGVDQNWDFLLCFGQKSLIKVWSEKKFTHVCVHYKKYATLCQKSFKSAKSRHPEDSKLVRQDHIIQKMLPGNMIE